MTIATQTTPVPDERDAAPEDKRKVRTLVRDGDDLREFEFLEDGADFVLSPGDTDEAVAGLLTNGMVASDVNGVAAPAGFTRILAYRLGLSSGVDECFERFS